MKNKKITILLEGVKKVSEELKHPQNAPNEQSTVKITYQSPESPVTITALQIKNLQQIFSEINPQSIIKDFSQYLTLPSQILGKRSSKIVLSKSSQYLLKIIQENDMNQIKKMLSPLLHRFQHCKTNCLVNIYYIFIVEYTISNVKLSDRYIVMPNIRANFDLCLRTFDIKGHLEAREIDHDDFVDFKFGKDENFVEAQELQLIKEGLTMEQKVNLIQEINQNIEFLTKLGILDYSLLFSFQKQQKETEQSNKTQKPCRQICLNHSIVLKWMIIDYFQIYNDKKKLQNKFKSIFRKSVSSVEPQIYSKRLIDFLKKYLLS